jgi:hypothetical protein
LEWRFGKLRVSSIDLDTIRLHQSISCQFIQSKMGLESRQAAPNQGRSGNFNQNIKI